MKRDNRFLKAVVASIREEMPKFNDFMLLELRQNMIAKIPEEVEGILRYLLLEQFPYIRYGGYRMCTPMELAQYIVKGKWTHVDVQDSHTALYKYSFFLMEDGREVECPLYLFVPYLFEQEFLLRGTAYYPMFTIMDKAILRIKNSKEKNSTKRYIGIEVPFILHKILFFFNDKCKHLFVDTTGYGYEATVIKTKAHHNVKSKNYPPALLYILAKYGYLNGIRFMGFDPAEIMYVTKPEETTEYRFIKITDSFYFKVTEDFLSNVPKKRILAALMLLYNNADIDISLSDIVDDKGEFFKYLLGRWVQKPDASPLQISNQAREHLITIDRTVDYRAKESLHGDGFMVNDFYELCRLFFYQIDELLIHKNNDLFHKKISITPQILYGFIRVLSASLFNKTQSGEILRSDILNGIFRKVTRLLIKNNEKMSSYMGHHDQCHDNWLLGIGCKKIRSDGLRDPFSGDDKSASSPDGGLRSDLSILAHPSHLFVESILNLPASNPCKGGSINPYMSGITSTGLFFAPPEYEEHKNIFTTDKDTAAEAYLLDPDDPWATVTDADFLEEEEEPWSEDEEDKT